MSPSAPRVELIGLYGDRLKVALSAPPEGNRANKQLEQALAGWLGLKRGSVEVRAGHASRDKVVAFTGTTGAELRSRLEDLLQGL